MQQITTIGLDLAKQVFQVHGAEADGSPVISRKLRRGDVLAFFRKLSPCLVGMEACGGVHYWAREIAKCGHDVRLFAAVALLYGALDRKSSPIAPALRSLVTVRVSQINHCAFCVDINSATLAKRGVSMEKIGAISNWRDNAIFEPEECLALEYAEAMTITSRGIDESLRARLKQQWDDEAVVELTALIAFQNLSSKFNAALDVPSQGFCLLPK